MKRSVRAGPGAGSVVRVAAAVAALIGALAGLGVIALAIGATRDPTSSAYAAIATSLWTTFGPHFVLIAVMSALLGILA